MSNTNSPTNRIWYLAYGSNMNPLVLSKRRKIFPTESLPCYVPGYVLNFDCKGIPYFEPSFASISKRKSGQNDTEMELQGVIHSITTHEMFLIRLSEGGNGHDGLGYDLIEIEVKTYDGRKLQAFTLLFQDPGSWRGHPSRRYMNLILDGAKQSQLELKYIQYLETLPIYERKGILQSIGSCLCGLLVCIVFLPFFLFLFISRKLTKERPPRCLIVTMNYGRDFTYLIHDYLLQPFFGSGFIQTKKCL